MSKNPYDTNNFPGKFQIDYLGREDRWYVLRLNTEGQKGLDTLMFQNEISMFMMMNAFGEWHMGNGFGVDTGLPAPKMAVRQGNEYYILIDLFADLISFENEFVVTGISPAKLAEAA